MIRWPLLVILISGLGNPAWCQSNQVIDQGAIVRTDTTRKNINLVFTGHEFADGYKMIREALNKYDIKSHFFFTGDFYRNPEFEELIDQLENDGHYLGAHSDKHLLYCSWENRDSLLVSKEKFKKDLKDNYKEMARFGIGKEDAPFFMPPYEWYNDSISRWTREMGLTLVNFSPGTYSNADWTYPGLGEQYLDSRTIYNRILKYEEKHNLNGFILLLHIGTDPRRKDKFYYKLEALIEELKGRGYRFTLLTETAGQIPNHK